MQILCEYQRVFKNARVYLTNKDSFAVEVYEGITDYSAVKFFNTFENARMYADDWVEHSVTA